LKPLKTPIQKRILHVDLGKIKGKNKLAYRRAGKRGIKCRTEKRVQKTDGGWKKRAAYEDD
jgi:hypothetical protein